VPAGTCDPIRISNLPRLAIDLDTMPNFILKPIDTKAKLSNRYISHTLRIEAGDFRLSNNNYIS